MTLEVVAESRSMRNAPFADSAGFREDWWCRLVTGTTPRTWVSFKDESGLDVARAELHFRSTVGAMYKDVEIPNDGFAEILFFEVRGDLRGTGVGREAVRLLRSAYEGQTFAAFSEGADEFWSAIGWREHVHQDQPRARLLFVSP